MTKRTLVVILAFIFILNNGISVASSPNWQISVEQNSSSLYREYSSPQYVISDNQNQVISLAYINYVQKDKIPPFFKNLLSTALIFRIGTNLIGFDSDYGTGHDKNSIGENIFWGYGATVDFKWNEAWSTSVRGILDYGKIDNQAVTWTSVRSGYAYAQRIDGSWSSSIADIGVSYKQGSLIYLFGVNAPSSRYSVAYSEHPGYPATYEVDNSFSGSQTYIYAGIKFLMFERFNLSSKIEYPLKKASSIGYSINLDYVF